MSPPSAVTAAIVRHELNEYRLAIRLIDRMLHSLEAKEDYIQRMDEHRRTTQKALDEMVVYIRELEDERDDLLRKSGAEAGERRTFMKE